MHGRSAAELCRAASIALAAARRSGPNASAVFDDALAAEVMERRSLLTALRGALGRGEFDLLYQPVIDLSQRRLHGVEVLLRWRHPTLGAVSPERFVPLLEELGQIRPVTEWLIDRSAADLKELMAGDPNLRLALNLVPAQIEPQQTANLLARLATVGCARVTLEITERAVLDASPATVAALAAARAAGVEVAIDDFGTGYSSLAYLERFAIDIVKIDKRFIARLERDGRLADAILGMAGALGLKPVAEGVETDAQLAWLASRGCRYVQGFLFAPPLDRAGISTYARNFAFPAGRLDAALWPRARALPRLLSENQEQALRLFVRHVPAAVAMFDSEMRYLVASDRWLDDFGIREQEIVGRCHYDVLPDTPERWRRIYARCLAEGTVERCEEDFYLRPDGSREWVRWEVHPFRNRLGDIAGITVFSEFVTARKDAELRLAQSEQRLREVLTSSSDWLWETDEQHRFVLNTDDRRKSNVGQSRVLWRTRWELAGVADPQAHSVWRDHLADLEAHRPFRKFEYSTLDDDGVPTHLEVSGAPIYDDQGTFRGYRGTACNITAHKEAERRLAQSEQRLREVLTSSSDWLWETDEQNRFVLHTSDERPGDAGYERRLGHTPWDLAGVEDPQSDPAWRAHLADLEARRPFRKFEYTASADDGTRVYCEVNGTPIFDEDGSFRGYRGTTCNITARKEAERRLAESEQRLRAYLATASDWAWEMGPDLRLSALVGDVERHGVDPQALLGRTRWDIAGVSDPDADPFWAAHKADLEARRPFRDLVYSFKDRAGRDCWMTVSGRPAFGQDGQFVGYFGTARDVTAVRLAEAQRARQHDCLDLACELARLAYWEVDYEHGAVEWSSRLYDIAGRDPASFRPDLRSRFEIFHPDDRARCAEVVQTAVAQRRPFDVRGRIVRPDGTIVHVISRGRARTDRDGRVRRYFGFMQDVTDQAQAELALQARSRENELYRTMIDALPDFIYAKDRAGRYLAANAATARLMRAGSVAEVIGQTDHEFYPVELADPWKADEDAFFERGGDLVILEQPCLRMDGQPGWHCSLMTPLRDRHGNVDGFVGHSRDITEQKHAAEEIRRLKAEAEQARDLLHMATGVMTEGFALFDPEDRLAHANEAFASFYDRPAEALVGMRFEDLQRVPWHSEGLELKDHAFETWLRTRLEWHARADGSPVEVWFRGKAFLVREQRMPNGWIVLLRAHVTHLKQVEQELRRLATTDTLTGAFNRRYFVEDGARLLAHCRQGGEPVALLLLDIDHFKVVNDSWGHAAGDEALRRVCEACQQRLRPGDLFARWGGEEFILLLPGATQEDALAVAERLRAGVAAVQLEVTRAGFGVTLSVGVAIGRPEDELEELTRRADRALYAAKASGRDRVVLAGREVGRAMQVAGSEGGGHAAVDRQDLPGDVAGILAAEEECRAGHILRGAGASEQDAAVPEVDVLEPGGIVLVAAAVGEMGHAGVDEAGGQGVDRDPAWAEIGR